MSEEKYISVEYDTWYNKYKPMEEKLARVERALEEEKRSKILRLIAHPAQYSFYSRFGNPQDIKIGTIEMSVEKPRFKDETDWRYKGFNLVKTMFEDALLDISHFGVPQLITIEKFAELIKILRHNEIRMEALKDENEKRIKGIPKFIKWMFKIK